MKTFETIDELWLDAVATIQNEGSETDSRVGGTREVLGYSARLTDTRYNFLLNPGRNLSPSYAAAELLWYLSGCNGTEMMEYYAPQYRKFTEGRGDTPGFTLAAYGFRWAVGQHSSEMAELSQSGMLPPCNWSSSVFNSPFPKHQLYQAAKLLRDKPDTRQAIITMWDSRDLPYALAGCRNDQPCTLSMQFLLRDGKLNAIVTMRSNDVWLGLPYDIFCFSSVQGLVAEWLGVEVGWYQHNVGSLHLYDKNKEKCEAAAASTDYSVEGLEFRPSGYGGAYSVAILQSLICEHMGRTSGVLAMKEFQTIGVFSRLGQMVLWTALKWADQGAKQELLKLITGDSFKKHCARFCK